MAGAVVFILLAFGLIVQAISWRQGGLLLVGAALGVALYHSSFGFTGGWRVFVIERRAAGIRAQMLMIGIATLFILPLLSLGQIEGAQILGGALGPVGVSLVVGAAMFGFGMQLGGGCASGTLFSVGGGNFRMLVTLMFFITGAVIGTAHLPWWASLPQIGVILPAQHIGVWPTLALQLAGLATVALVATGFEKRRHGEVRFFASSSERRSWILSAICGPWPLGWGSVALGVLSVVTFIVAGHPWSITFAFNLWGAKLLAATGIDVASWEYWTWPMPAQALRAPILAETTSVLDFGLVLGALLAAGLAGRFAPDIRIPLRSLAGAIVGGLLMGYGARLGFGCNIGAFLGGISSGSLHGWVWFAAAFVGSLAGIKARPLFGLGR